VPRKTRVFLSIRNPFAGFIPFFRGVLMYATLTVQGPNHCGTRLHKADRRPALSSAVLIRPNAVRVVPVEPSNHFFATSVRKDLSLYVRSFKNVIHSQVPNDSLFKVIDLDCNGAASELKRTSSTTFNWHHLGSKIASVSVTFSRMRIPRSLIRRI
jgi:hypothetical protein